VPGAGTFVGQSQSTAIRRSIGLVVPTLSNPYFGELSEAVEKEASGRGYDLLMGQSNYIASTESSYLQRYAENPAVSGALVVPNLDSPPLAAYNYMHQRRFPFVFVARWNDSVDTDAVAVDGQRGSRDIVRYLISLGHRRIGYIQGGPRQPDIRLRGYEDALREAGIDLDPDLIVLQETIAEQAGLEGVRTLFERGARFTAIYARNDVTAMGVLQGLAEANLSVPADMSLVGFDNILSSAHVQPALTTVDHPVQEIARLAVSLLLDRVEGRYDGPPRRVSVQPKLVIRASCAALSDVPVLAGRS
jgi:DNA-binding LacI/PurR family transcriptional regulator